MTTYRPYGIKELQALLQQAKAQQQPVLTRHQRRAGLGLDFQNWNKIREIDTANLTVTAERAVSLGELEDAVHAHGLHVAAMTEDLRTVTLGDFFAEQMFCLTSLHDKQPRFQVLGLEIMLLDGTVLSVAGKTVKNVTGYDMCRFYLSNREQLALPLAFTIKLVSQEAVQVMLEADVADSAILPELAWRLRAQNVRPKVCLYWNHAASVFLQHTEPTGRLVLLCSGDKQRVEKELQVVQDATVDLLQLQPCVQPEQVWHEIRALRNGTLWPNGLKVPSLRCGEMLQQLAEHQLGCWYNPMEGALQLMPANDDGAIYQTLCQAAQALGGDGNWYLMQQYGFAPAGATAIWQILKQQFDPEQRLNPCEKGGAEDGTK